jgi:hypothetical protein
MKNIILFFLLFLSSLTLNSFAQETNALIPSVEAPAATLEQTPADPTANTAPDPTAVNADTEPIAPTPMQTQNMNLKDNYFTQHLFELFHTTPPKPFEKTYTAQEMPKAPSFDNRVWKVGFFRYNNQGGIIEYVLENETVMAWNELLTILNLVNPGINNIEEIQNTLTQTIKQTCKNFQSNIISRNENEILFEWGATNCTAPDLIYSPHKDEFEISRIIKTPQGYWVIQYASANPIADDKKSQWANIIASIELPQ